MQLVFTQCFLLYILHFHEQVAHIVKTNGKFTVISLHQITLTCIALCFVHVHLPVPVRSKTVCRQMIFNLAFRSRCSFGMSYNLSSMGRKVFMQAKRTPALEPSVLSLVQPLFCSNPIGSNLKLTKTLHIQVVLFSVVTARLTILFYLINLRFYICGVPFYIIKQLCWISQLKKKANFMMHLHIHSTINCKC